MIITFCGHSDYVPSVGDEQKILDILSKKIGGEDAELYLGGYGAFDAFARKCGREYQKTHPRTKLILVTPYLPKGNEKQEGRGPDDLYDEIVYPPLERVPPRFAISRRNEWMVERADCVIAYVRHEWGGAYKTYCHAQKKQKEIYHLAEKSHE